MHAAPLHTTAKRGRKEGERKRGRGDGERRKKNKTKQHKRRRRQESPPLRPALPSSWACRVAWLQQMLVSQSLEVPQPAWPQLCLCLRLSLFSATLFLCFTLPHSSTLALPLKLHSFAIVQAAFVFPRNFYTKKSFEYATPPALLGAVMPFRLSPD